MSRRSYRYVEVTGKDGKKTVKAVEIGAGHVPEPRSGGRKSEAERRGDAFVIDVRMVKGKPIPVRIDISSKTKERRYFDDVKARTGRELTNSADFKEHWAKKAQERERIASGDIGGDRERKADIGQTLYQLRERARRRR